MFDSPKPDLFVFCEWVREEAVHWEKMYEDAHDFVCIQVSQIE